MPLPHYGLDGVLSIADGMHPDDLDDYGDDVNETAWCSQCESEQRVVSTRVVNPADPTLVAQLECGHVAF